MVTVSSAMLEPFEAFTCFNSPYVAHDDGRAIDLYPGEERAPSPVAGEVVAIERVRAPPKPYAPDHDVLIVVDTGEPPGPVAHTPDGPALARVLHVEPSVAVGDRVALGDDLGRLLRAGFFAPWVANHIHLGFRAPGTDPRRASGSLRISLGVDPEGIAWDGRGRVARTGPTYVELEPPDGLERRNPDEWVGLATDAGGVLDGGLPHYANGGRLETLVTGRQPPSDGTVRFLGTRIGEAADRRVRWDDLTVRAGGTELTGLSLSCARADRFRPKLIRPQHRFGQGEHLSVTIHPSTGDP